MRHVLFGSTCLSTRKASRFLAQMHVETVPSHLGLGLLVQSLLVSDARGPLRLPVLHEVSQMPRLQLAADRQHGSSAVWWLPTLWILALAFSRVHRLRHMQSA